MLPFTAWQVFIRRNEFYSARLLDTCGNAYPGFISAWDLPEIAAVVNQSAETLNNKGDWFSSLLDGMNNPIDQHFFCGLVKSA